MKSIKLNIKNLSDSVYVLNKQKQYSYAFRKLWNNYNEINNKEYFKYLQKRFSLTDIEVRSLISEVKTKFEQTLTNKSKTEIEIINIENKIKDLKSEIRENKTKFSNKDLTRKLFKFNIKLRNLNKSLSNDIVFGGRKLLSEITHLSNDKTNNEKIILNKKEEYQHKRLLMAYFIGEANQNGNRFFDFDFKNKIIIYKPNRKIKIRIEISDYNSYKKELLLLQEMIGDKSIAVTVQLSAEYVTIIFDDKKLYGYALDEKTRRIEINKIKSEHIDKEKIKILIKRVYSKFYKSLEEKQLHNKLDYRYLSFDTNPDHIGISILDKINNNGDFKIVKTFDFDLSDNNKSLSKQLNKEQRNHLNNKRRHGITHVWKSIFELFTYYRCGYLVMEELNLKNKDLNNKTANRKINNVWYRELSNQLIDKYCNKLGIIKIEINPVYSSFIGNLNYDFIDPINAAIEIGRRGINKYIKNKFYPPIDVDHIISTMSKLNSNLDLNELRDVLFLKNTGSWSELYKLVGKMGLRYRIKLEDIDIDFSLENKLLHSNIKKYCFDSQELAVSEELNNNYLKIHNYA